MLILAVVLLGVNAIAKGMDDDIRCGVYLRIVIGEMTNRERRDNVDLSALISDNKQVMHRYMDSARRAAIAETDEVEGQQYFDEQWRTTYALMIGQIDNNYRRIHLLRSRYAQQCKAGPDA